MSADEEEPDYMSDEFLKQCTGGTDVRPSLLHSRADRRQLEIVKRQSQQNKSKEEREAERLKAFQDSLNVPISEDNKGFKMLQKMGFKPGSALGKSESSQGLKEPIKIDLKRGRGGLGQQQHKKAKYEESLQLGNTDEYRKRRQAEFKTREISHDVRKAQGACQNLDVAAGLTPPEPWFWPEVKKPLIEDEDKNVDEEEPENPADAPYFKYAKDSDSDSDDEDDIIKDKDNDTNNETKDDDEDDAEEVPVEEKLEKIVLYLKTKYHYCIWCGTKYESSDDMDLSCPGSKDDH